MRHREILIPDRTALMVVDIQEKLVPSLPQYPELQPNIVRLIQVADALKMKVILTEQYPKGLGVTIPSIQDILPEYAPVVKNTFSCCGVDDVPRALSENKKEAVILVGMEAHVCIQQTALDLIEHGYRVHVPADAVVSRFKLDWQMAIDRMRQAGAIVPTSRSIIFELLKESGTPTFKAVLPFLKE